MANNKKYFFPPIKWGNTSKELSSIQEMMNLNLSHIIDIFNHEINTPYAQSIIAGLSVPSLEYKIIGEDELEEIELKGDKDADMLLSRSLLSELEEIVKQKHKTGKDSS